MNRRRALAGIAALSSGGFPSCAVCYGRRRGGRSFWPSGNEISRGYPIIPNHVGLMGSGPPPLYCSFDGECARTRRDYFRWFWADGFMPLPPRNISDVFWYQVSSSGCSAGRDRDGARWRMNYRWSPVFAVVMAMGFWMLWRSSSATRRYSYYFPIRRMYCTVSGFPVSIHRPRHRVLIPSLILATAAGASHLLTKWPDRLNF